MIIDFSLLKEIVQDYVINLYDHSDLNEFFVNPTAELMVHDIWYNLQNAFKLCSIEVELEEIRLWETPDSYAEMRRD